MPDPLAEILRMVAEGTLTPDEASPLIDALSAGRSQAPRPPAGPEASPAVDVSSGPGRRGRAIRIEITEDGRKVVNMRVPLALGSAAIGRVPGLSETLTTRIREAIESGVVGPILEVDEGPDQVRIVVE
jgi:hypothetical protein